MEISRFFKIILFVFESAVFLLISTYMIAGSVDQAGLPHIAFASSAALFPLIALFIWLDGERYRVYMPLFAAGKCIGVFSVLGWSIIAGHVRIIDVLSGNIKIESFLLYSYLFSLIVIALIIREKIIMDNKNNGDSPGEENKLEVE